MANNQAQTVQTLSYSSQEVFLPVKGLLNKKRNTHMKRHLERDGKSVKIVEDGIVDHDAEIQSQLKNAGLQNILKLQELRYGTVDNAIARAADKGIYADVSNIPTDISGQAAFIQAAQAKIAKLKAELGLSDEDIKNLSIDRLTEIYTEQAKVAAAPNASQEGGAE